MTHRIYNSPLHIDNRGKFIWPKVESQGQLAKNRKL